MYKKSLGRFKFTLKDNYKFNYSVIINIICLNGKPVLQVINFVTVFEAIRFLKDILAYIVQDIFYTYWINTYLSPPDIVIYNTKKNFVFIEFKQLANLIVIKIIEVLVEVYNSIGLIKRYYIPL